MKTKILLIFVLFTISLFGQFEEKGNNFSVGVDEEYSEYFKERQDIHCQIFTFDYEQIKGFRIIISFTLPEKPKYFNIGNFSSYFSDDLTTQDKYHTSIKQPEHLAYIFRQIVEGEQISIKTDKAIYFFDFSKYKNDIEKSKFYKRLIEEY